MNGWTVFLASQLVESFVNGAQSPDLNSFLRSKSNVVHVLFSAPAFLLKKFSPEQIQQGLTLIETIELCLSSMIWKESIDFELMKLCILSMVNLYKELFALDPIGHQSAMWWDGMILWDEDKPETPIPERCVM